MSTLDMLFHTSPAVRAWEHYKDMQEYLYEKFQEVEDQASSTSDYPALAKQKGHYLFVYNGLKQGFKYHEEISKFPCVGVGHTNQDFRMYYYKDGNLSYPIITYNDLQKGTKYDNAVIYGEIYKVSPEYIAECDWRESNRVLCFRAKLPVTAVIDTNGTTKQIWPWIYIHRSSYWFNRKEKLKEIPRFTSKNNNQKYYNFIKAYEYK